MPGKSDRVHGRKAGGARRTGLFAALVGAAVCLAGPGLAQTDRWQEEALARARALYLETLPEICLAGGGVPTEPPPAYPLWIGEESASREALLVQFPCRIDGVSQSFVFVLADQYGEASPVVFPAPVVEVRDAQAVVTAVVERRDLMNPRYDTDGRTMEAYDRQPDGTQALTRWGFRHGKFEIMRFEIDVTADGLDNPQILIEQDIW